MKCPHWLRRGLEKKSSIKHIFVGQNMKFTFSITFLRVQSKISSNTFKRLLMKTPSCPVWFQMKMFTLKIYIFFLKSMIYLRKNLLAFRQCWKKNDKPVVSLIWSCFVNMFKDIFLWGANLKKHLRHHMQHARVPSRDLQSVLCIGTELLNQERKHKTFYFITLNKYTRTSQKGGADYRLKCEQKCCTSWRASSDSPSFYSSLCGKCM